MLRFIGLAAIALTTSAFAPTPSPLSTVAEQSGYQRTGRYGEVERLCKAFAAKWPQDVRCFEFGRSPEGRPMLGLAASRTGALTAADAQSKSLPVMLLQGGIHAGEIDGKDAGFLLLREMLENRSNRGALDKMVWVFVPVLNVDGHERFGPWNRPNQVGPEEMGWRVTSQNLNLNRDYMKADASEMQAMLRLLNEWDPILYIDLHVTDGAQFQHDIANLVEPIYVGDPKLQPLGVKLRDETNARLAAKGALPLSFYPSLLDNNDPSSGFSAEASTPRFATGYWPLSNRFALLVETHAWKDYRTRVGLTHDTLVALTDIIARDGQTLLKAVAAADRRATALGGRTVTLGYKITDKHHTIDFKGYAYSFEPSAISGKRALKYDASKPQIWRIPFYDEVVPDLQVTAPKGGYIVPAGHAAWMKQRLDVHGIEYRVLQTAPGERTVETFRVKSAQYPNGPFEGHMTAKLTGEWKKERRPIGAGALFVPVAQPKSRLVMALLEPRATDSFAAWGFFNAHFETKEYMEHYVAEEVGRKMLAENPKIAAEFKHKLASDPEFTKDPNARLEFFHRRHSSWDERVNLYPIMRTAQSVRGR